MHVHALSTYCRGALLRSVALVAIAMPSRGGAETVPAPAAADVAASAAASTGDNADIVVTARNRAEKLQDVPLAITSFDSKDLAAANVRNLRDVSYLTPGLTISSGGSEFGVNPIIRGQTNLNGGSGDPNVAVFLDGIYISNSTAINLGLIDIERIEVVKGPVSALYGRNAFAGAINYVSKKPSTEVASGNVTAFVGNDGQYSASGSISYPLVKNLLGVRLAAGYENYDGGYRDQVNGLRAGGFEKRDFQGVVLLTPTPDLTLTGSYYYGNDTFGTSAIAYNANNCGARTSPPTAQDPSGGGYAQFCGRFDPDAHPVEVAPIPAAAGGSGNSRKVNLASLNVAYDFGFAKLTSLTGYSKVTQQRYTDFIARRAGIPFLLTPGPGTVNEYELFGSNSNNEDFSEELRLQTDPSKPLRFQLGGFYYKDRTFSTTLVGIGGNPIPAGQSLLPGFPADSYSANGVISTNRVSQSLSHDKQVSGFVGVEYDILTGLTASGEYRYTSQDKDQIILRSTGCSATLTVASGSCTGPAPTPYLYPNGTTPAAGTFNFSNYRGTLKYALTPSSQLYGSVANGNKAGGFNQRSVALPDGSQPDLKYNPEVNTTFEIGSKNSFFNNSLLLNIALYHINTKGIQISGPSSVPTNPGLVTKNFGSVHTDGFEVEMNARVAPGARVHAGVGYADPRFGSDAYDFGAASGCAALVGGVIVPLIASCASRVIIAQPGTPLNPVSTAAPKLVLQLNGLHVPRESNLQLTGGIDLDGPIGGDWTWNATYNARYESKVYAFNNNISYYGPRTVMNVRAGVANKTYSVSLYVNNLTDDHTPETASVNARLSDFQGDLDGYLPVARQFGLTVGAKF